MVGIEERDVEEKAALRAHQALSWTPTLSFAAKKMAGREPTPTPNSRGEASPANNTGRRFPGPNCMLTERWDEPGLN